MRTRIKFCGLCRPDDAALAASLGVDAVGIVRVAEAGRFVDRDMAREIAHRLPPFVTPVLLYVNTPARDILADLAAIGRPAMVQLNGEEAPAYLPGIRVIKAVRVDDRLPANIAAWTSAAAIVLESPGQTGGSGVSNNWADVASHAEAGAFKNAPPLIVAGGLTPGNVGDVIRFIRPYCVDVSSGVEHLKREKDATLMRQFVDAVHAADALVALAVR